MPAYSLHTSWLKSTNNTFIRSRSYAKCRQRLWMVVRLRNNTALRDFLVALPRTPIKLPCILVLSNETKLTAVSKSKHDDVTSRL